MGCVVNNNYILGANQRSDPNLDHRRLVTKDSQPAQNSEIFVLHESIDPKKSSHVSLWQLEGKLEPNVNFGDANIDHKKDTLLSEFIEISYVILDGQAPPLQDLNISQSAESESLSKINTNTHLCLETHEIPSKLTPNQRLIHDNSSRQLIDYVAPETGGCIPNLPVPIARRPASHDISDISTSKGHHQPLLELEPTCFQNSLPWVDNSQYHLVKTEYQNGISPLTLRQETLGAQFSPREIFLKYLENNRTLISFIFSPNELGRIRLDINRDKNFSIRVRADRVVTRELLQEHLALFLNELNLDGILDADVYFDNSNEEGEQFFNNHSETHLIASLSVMDRESYGVHHAFVSRALAPLASLNLRF